MSSSTGLPRGEKDFSALIARLQKREYRLLFYYGGYYPKWARCCARRSVGLKTQFMGPEGVGNAPV